MTDEPVHNRKPAAPKEISPFYDEHAEQEAVSGMTAEIKARMNPLMDQMVDPRNMLKFRHGSLWTGPEVEHADTEGEFTLHSHELETKFADILAGNIDLLDATINEMTNKMSKSFSDLMISKMHEATAKTGNIVKIDENRSFPEVLIEMYQKIKFGVGIDGKISLPTMMASPSQQKKFKAELAAMDDATRRELDAIIGERVREAIASEQARRARFESPRDAET